MPKTTQSLQEKATAAMNTGNYNTAANLVWQLVTNLSDQVLVEGIDDPSATTGVEDQSLHAPHSDDIDHLSEIEVDDAGAQPPIPTTDQAAPTSLLQPLDQADSDEIVSDSDCDQLVNSIKGIYNNRSKENLKSEDEKTAARSRQIQKAKDAAFNLVSTFIGTIDTASVASAQKHLIMLNVMFLVFDKYRNELQLDLHRHPYRDLFVPRSDTYMDDCMLELRKKALDYLQRAAANIQTVYPNLLKKDSPSALPLLNFARELQVFSRQRSSYTGGEPYFFDRLRSPSPFTRGKTAAQIQIESMIKQCKKGMEPTLSGKYEMPIISGASQSGMSDAHTGDGAESDRSSVD